MTVWRVIGNSLAFLLSVMLAIWTFETNPVLSFLFILSAIDNYEDIYEVVKKRKMIPTYLIPVDIIFEIIMLMFGIYIFMLGFLYWSYFETPFALFLLISGVSIVFSSTKDIVKQIRRLKGVIYAMGVHKIKEYEWEFVRRKK